MQIRRLTMILASLLVFALAAVFFIRAWRVSHSGVWESSNIAEKSDTKKTGNLYASLDGSLQADQVMANRQPVAVVVENFPSARPQSGLSQADLVYETVAEGGITRFLAVFQTQKAENIGPIRSARTYFAEIADELGAIFGHVGGNSDVLENLRQGQYQHLLNLDQFFQDKYFHRISARPMPHNVYSSTDKLFAYPADLKKMTRGEYGNWLYSDKFSGAQFAEKIDIQFSTAEYAVSYVYNRSLASYERFLAGQPHFDAEGKSKILIKNVIIQSVRTWPVKTDTPFSISMDLFSGGPAYIFAEGKGIAGTWKKKPGDRTRYYDETGKEVEFLRGITWVELVPEEKMGELQWTGKETIK